MQPASGAIQPDRTLQGNDDLARRGLQGGWSHFAAVFMIAVATPFWHELPATGRGVSAILVGVTLWRLWLILRWRGGKAGPRWRRGYEVAIAITAACWGLMLGAAYLHFGVDRWTTTLIVIVSVGISMGGLMALAPHIRLLCLYLLLTWVPAAAVCIATGAAEHYATAVMIFLFVAYSLVQARLLHTGYWSDWRRSVDLEQAKQAAEAASRAKSEFLANISHEIRTPMHGVLGMLNASLESEMPPDQRDLIETAKLSAESLLALLNDILDFSKTEAGKLQLEIIAFDVKELVASTVKGFSTQASRKNLVLEFAAGPGVPRMVMGDPTRLRQILSNLIGNAIKFTPSGSVHAGLEALEPRPGTASLRFSVTDTGVGIPIEKQAVIFESFAQADGATTRRFGGTGLGLTICSRLTEMMGGRIAVSSEPGCGSTFAFTLTLGVPVATPAEVPETQPGEKSVSRPRLRILVAEDNPINQRLAVRLLEKEGHDVTIAADGREAVATWDSGSFDAVLMDIQMPDMDGYEATSLIRAMESARGTRTPIIGVTANALDGDRERCLAAGMDGYLAKPFKASDLYALIDAHVPGAHA